MDIQAIMDTLRQWLNLLGPNRYAQALIVVVVSFVLAKLADWIISGVIARWAGRTQTEFDDRLIALLHRPVFVSVFIAGLAIATRRLALPDTAAWLTIAALKTIAIVVWLMFGIGFIRLLLRFLLRHQDRFPLIQERTIPLMENLALAVFFGGALYFTFLAWDIDVTAWLASAGIIGLALSFAARDTLANLFAGVSILADAPYKIGDFVMLDSGERGRVTHIGVRSTRLLTRDDIEVTIPNALMGNSKIINESGGPYEKERIRIQVGVAYGSDIDRVREALLAVAREHPEICSDPEPRVRFRSFGDSGLVHELLCWISEPVLRGRILDELNSAVYKKFLQEGIEIPYPKRDVYIKGMPGPERSE